MAIATFLGIEPLLGTLIKVNKVYIKWSNYSFIIFAESREIVSAAHYLWLMNNRITCWKYIIGK